MVPYVLETAPVPALHLDARHCVTEANTQARQVLRSDGVGRPLAEQIVDCNLSVRHTPVVSGNMLYVPCWNNEGDAAFLAPLPPWAELIAKYDKDNDHKISKEECAPDLLVLTRPGLPANEPSAHFRLRGAFEYFDTNKDGGISQAIIGDVIYIRTASQLYAFRASGPAG